MGKTVPHRSATSHPADSGGFAAGPERGRKYGSGAVVAFAPFDNIAMVVGNTAAVRTDVNFAAALE